MDLQVEKKRFLQAILKVEPRFDFKKADAKILNSIFGWVWREDQFNVLNLDYDKGLYFYGTLGRGKSTTLRALQVYMNDIYNRMLWKYDGDYRMGMRWKVASELANVYAADGQPGLTYYYDCEVNLCIDEVGREPNPASNYGTKLDVVQFLLQMRYDNRRTTVTHLTTNLSIQQMTRLYGEYVADRCIELFNFIEFTGPSLRR